MTMTLTPLANFTDEELMRMVCTKDNPTDLEIELMHRLEFAKDALCDGEEQCKHATKYK